MKIPKVRLYVRIRRSNGADAYVDPAWNRNRTLRLGYALVNAQHEHHPEGIYYLRYARGGKRLWEAVGKDPEAALIAKRNLEHDLTAAALGRIHQPPPLANLVASVKNSLTTSEAIATYLQEVRQFKSKKTIASCENILGEFGKHFGSEPIATIARADLLNHMVALKAGGRGERTVFNHIARITTLLRANDIRGLLRPADWPVYEEKEVDAYHAEELTALLSACSSDQRLVFEFFVQTGFREAEVMHSTWANVNFRDKVITVRSKPRLGFKRCLGLEVPDSQSAATEVTGDGPLASE